MLFPADGGATHVRCEPVTGRCPLCQIPILDGDEVFPIESHSVHTRCQDRASTGGVVADYLQQHPGLALCHSCLGTRLGLGWETVRKLVWSLRTSPEFDVRPATCAGCAGPRVTIKAEAAAGR